MLGQKKLLKWSVPGAAHFFVFWAFLILATVYLEAYGSLLGLLFGRDHLDWAIPVVGHWAVLGFAQDFIAVMAFFGIATFVVIRLRNAPKDLGRRSRFFGLPPERRVDHALHDLQRHLDDVPLPRRVVRDSATCPTRAAPSSRSAWATCSTGCRTAPWSSSRGSACCCTSA